MKAFAIIKMNGGSPEIGGLPCRGYVLCAHSGQNWGGYIVSGTPAQLQAINALPDTYAICAVTETGVTKWPELDNVISEAVRARLNTWLGALIGVVLYIGSRLFAPAEEESLSKTFGADWDRYSHKVMIPWL